MYLPENLHVVRQHSVMKKDDARSLVSATRLRLSFHVAEALCYAVTDVRACVRACMFSLLPFVCVDLPL